MTFPEAVQIPNPTSHNWDPVTNLAGKEVYRITTQGIFRCWADWAKEDAETPSKIYHAPWCDSRCEIHYEALFDREAQTVAIAPIERRQAPVSFSAATAPMAISTALHWIDSLAQI